MSRPTDQGVPAQEAASAPVELLLHFDDEAAQAGALARELGVPARCIACHRFPDGELRLTLPAEVALYLLNQKRDGLVRVEQRYAMRVEVAVDPELTPGHHAVEMLQRRAADEVAPSRPAVAEEPVEPEPGPGPPVESAPVVPELGSVPASSSWAAR